MKNTSSAQDHIRTIKVIVTQAVTAEDNAWPESAMQAREAGARRLLLRGHQVISYDVTRYHRRTARDLDRGVRRFTVSVNVLA